MSLKPENGKPRKKDQFLGYVKNVFRSRSPSMTHPGRHTPSTSLVQPEDVSVDRDQPSAVPQSVAQQDFGSLDCPRSPINLSINQKKTDVGETAIELVKESLKVVARISDVFPPLKTVAAGLVEIFDRIDAVKGVQTEAAQLHDQVEKLVKMLEAYQHELPASEKDRLDGLHRALEEKRMVLEKKLNRSLTTRIIFSTEDTQFMVQVLREITFSIEVTTFNITLTSNLEISKMSGNTSKMADDISKIADKVSNISGNISQINNNTILEKLGHIVGAEFNREDRQGCTLGTRVSLLADLLSWATAGDSPHVFWLNGMAGTGKTTVLETFCSLLNKKGILGASFFCSIKSRRDVRSIFPSIAKTLAGNHPRFREILVEELITCSDPLGMDLRDQYCTLILRPAEAAFSADEIIVITVDALDECEDQEGIEMLLNTILDQKPNVPLRFFVTSRPEWHIREVFKQRHHLSLRLHDIEDHVVQADIAIYLNDRLGGVRKLRQYYGDSWPPVEIGIIVERAGKLFIYASTISKYITSYRGDPCDRLKKVTALHSPVAVAVENIEKLYSFILSEAFTGIDDEEASRIWSCLSILVSTQRPLSVSTYAKLLGTRTVLVRTALESLHSVIIVPDSDDDPRISIYHASFLDYLETLADMQHAHNKNATRCFRFMNSELRLGISGAITSHRSNDDQPQALLLPAHLKYTCTAWGYLVLRLIGPDDLIVEDIQTQIEAFLRGKFLYWLEMLSAMSDVPHASRILYRLSQKVSESHLLKLILIDFLKFTNTFLHPIRYCAPHIYLSALPFTSPTSMVSKLFLPKFPSLPVIHRSTDDTHTQHPILQFEGHKRSVTCVAFSPDGKYIGSGSKDYTIQLWNVETGEAAFKPLEGHEDCVTSVAFSHDGKYIASGSDDHTIRLWNVETGKMTSKSFEGDIIDCATSVSFTSDGKYITFVTKGHTTQLFRLWNIETGETALKSFEWQNNHKSRRCVAFSPDRKYIAFGFDYSGIQLWDIETDKEAFKLKLFEGHGEMTILSVSFSPDGKYIVSGSLDGMVQLWNVETGEAALKPIDGHKDAVRSVIFSPDGEYIVSGSDDCTIRIWNVETGEAALNSLEGHTSWIRSVSFSPDGKYIVSGSFDRTVRLWKFETNKVASRSFEGHTSPITSVSFSPDGKRLASGSRDRTIRLWNVETGRVALEPFRGHTDSVTSVSFSPNGEYIASGSRDRMTRLWNAKTGEPALAPLEGHTSSVTCVSFSPDGKHIASLSVSTLRLWTVKTGETALESAGIGGNSFSFSPDGTYIASGSLDGTIQLWNIKTGEAASKPLEVHKDSVWCIAFSPDGKYIAVGSENGSIRLWSVETGEAAWESSQGLRDDWDAVTSLAFSPDGKHIISGSYYKRNQLGAVETDRLVSKCLELGHQEAVNSVSFSLDGKYIASGSDDHTIRIYNYDSAEQIHFDHKAAQARFFHQCPTGSVVMDDEGWLRYPSDELLLWVPPGSRLGLYFPGVVHVIGTDRIDIEVSQFMHGTEWLRCQERRCATLQSTILYAS